jgi:hypothetical protein
VPILNKSEKQSGSEMHIFHHLIRGDHIIINIAPALILAFFPDLKDASNDRFSQIKKRSAQMSDRFSKS